MARRHSYRRLRICLLAAVTAIPFTIGMARAASTVQARQTTSIQRDYGRAGGDPYWTYRTQQPVPAPITMAYDQAKDRLSQAAKAAPPQQLERYGRGGGYVGLDKFEALDWSTRSQLSAAATSDVEGRTGG
jgi:hypothetical protein